VYYHLNTPYNAHNTFRYRNVSKRTLTRIVYACSYRIRFPLWRTVVYSRAVSSENIALNIISSIRLSRSTSWCDGRPINTCGETNKRTTSTGWLPELLSVNRIRLGYNVHPDCTEFACENDTFYALKACPHGETNDIYSTRTTT